MKTLTLKSQKSESLILGLLALALSGFFLYWVIKGNHRIHLPALRANRQASAAISVFLLLISLYSAVTLLIRYVSLRGYDHFVVKLAHDSITYPEHRSFRGYRPVTIARAQIQRASLHDFGKNTFVVSLDDANDHSLGKIPGDLCPHTTMHPDDLAKTINAWLAG